MPTNEAVCGYFDRRVVIPATGRPAGLSVEMLAGDAVVGQPTPIRFRVVLKPQETPVDDLQVEHEKLMHVIGVRDDLGAFIHVHPQRAAPGLWEIIHTFTNAGNFQIWSDVKRLGTVYSVTQPRLRVAGPPSTAATGPIPRWECDVSQYHVTLVPERTRLVAGATNRFTVQVRNQLGPPIAMDFYLGALMHLVLVKDDLTVYSHAHAEGHELSNRPGTFQAVFPVPGRYKIFAEFRPHKASLAPQEALLADFWVEVGPS